MYDAHLERMLFFDRKEIIKALRLKPGERVLEMGVGTGVNLPQYPAGIEVVGIDISRAALTRARWQAAGAQARISLRQMDAARLRFASRTFDKALATHLIRVVSDARAVLEEVARVTAPDALFVVVDQFKDGLLSRLMEPFQRLLGRGKNHDLQQLVRGTPWSICSQRRFGSMPGTKLVVLAKV